MQQLYFEFEYSELQDIAIFFLQAMNEMQWFKCVMHNTDAMHCKYISGA